jgi:hypothetical protein
LCPFLSCSVCIDICSKHGTFRPKLHSLVKENPAEQVESLSKDTFAAYFKSLDAAAAVKEFTVLRGIGPATASLIISVADPEKVVFFGDEVFRWLLWDEESKAGKGWDRKIGYNLKEYKALAEKAKEICERLGVRAADVERVGWVLGKENQDIDGKAGKKASKTDSKANVKAEKKDEEKEEQVKPEVEEKKKPNTTSKKRKETDVQSTSSRRSKRSK